MKRTLKPSLIVKEAPVSDSTQGVDDIFDHLGL